MYYIYIHVFTIFKCDYNVGVTRSNVSSVKAVKATFAVIVSFIQHRFEFFNKISHMTLLRFCCLPELQKMA